MTCDNISTSTWPVDESLNFILINIVHSKVHNKQLNQFTSVTKLHLQKNNIKTICLSDKFNKNIKFLDMSFNNISKMHDSCLRPLRNLQFLNISHNFLKHAPSKSVMKTFQNLLTLDISFNSILIFPKYFFTVLPLLKAISISHYTPQTIENNINHDRLGLLITNDFHVCCFTPDDAICTSPVIWPFACGSLLGTLGLEITIWSAAFIILIFNIISMGISICGIRKSSDSSSYDKIILCLSFSDSMIGLHLFIIAGADAYFGMFYMSYDISWRGNGFCHFASIFTIFANIMSMYTLGFLSVSRLQLTINPLTTEINEPKLIRKVILIGLFINLFVIACIITVIAILLPVQPLPLCIRFKHKSPYVNRILSPSNYCHHP